MKQRQRMNLAGDWRFAMDMSHQAITKCGGWYDYELPDIVKLPGTTETNMMGVATTVKDVDHINAKFEYIGAAWYQKDVEIPADAEDGTGTGTDGEKMDVLVDDAQNLEAFVQTDGVDVVQSDLALPQRGGTHDIAQNVPGEDGTAGAHKGDFQHSGVLLKFIFSFFSLTERLQKSYCKMEQQFGKMENKNRRGFHVFTCNCTGMVAQYHTAGLRLSGLRAKSFLRSGGAALLSAALCTGRGGGLPEKQYASPGRTRGSVCDLPGRTDHLPGK